ncbi:MAG TPA: VIT1/CCC1 transporter family protein [Candidatus Paceibacterota bacterium]
MDSVLTEQRKNSVSYIRNFVFGVEDSLVSTVGLLSGIAIAEVPRATIFLTGVVLIFVEAFSMAAGSFLSEYSAQEYADAHDEPMKRPLWSGFIMFFSYFISGFIPLFPYAFFETSSAFTVSIALSLLALFVLGVIGARLSQRKILRRSIRMVVIGGAAIGIGILAGKLFSIGLGI